MLPLRLVLDTNIVVSAALKPSSLQRTILTLALTKPARLYVSDGIVAEYREVLARPELSIRKGLRLQILQLIKNGSFVTHPSTRLDLCPDTDDNRFLECAEAANADYLITGNLKHFPAQWKRTHVVNSRTFLDLIAPYLASE
jgi:putative PIN family toxin of toxin-antitoxin system